jgi:hypothetical protein
MHYPSLIKENSKGTCSTIIHLALVGKDEKKFRPEVTKLNQKYGNNENHVYLTVRIANPTKKVEVTHQLHVLMFKFLLQGLSLPPMTRRGYRGLPEV